MPAQSKKTSPLIKINLLPQDPFMESIVGKFLMWALSIGRYIVIFTELIVILTFLSRFKLDRDLTDLKEKLVRQKAIIQSYQDVERNFLLIQQRINFLSTKQQNDVVIPSLSTLMKLLPVDVRLAKLSIQQNGWSLSAQALSAKGMKTAIDQVISQYPTYDVSVTSVRLDSKLNAIVFNLSASQKVGHTAQPKQPTQSTSAASNSEGL